jgi:predicted RNase H-like nuclease
MGVDGCRGGWLVAMGDPALSRVDFRVVATFADVLRYRTTLGANCLIDVPIGLEEASARGCDLDARQLLGPKRQSSVFPAPCRRTLQARSFEEACAINRAACGKAITQQLFAILPKIREVNGAMGVDLQQVVREAHPEVSFAVISNRMTGIKEPKKTSEGRAERIRVLQPHLGQGFDPREVKRQLGSAVALDDIIDAAVCLVSAQRAAQGRALVLPRRGRHTDSSGLRMEIVA